MGQATLLRTLTEKSVMGFGKYYDLIVKYLLDLNKTTYLRWCYFNSSKITFTDEILEKIHIPNDFKIEKPGKCPEKHDQLNSILWKKISSLNKLKKESHRRKVTRVISLQKEIQDRRINTRGKLQRKNHGKSR